RRRHTRSKRDWSSDVCSSDLEKMYEQCVDAVIILGGSMDGIVIDEKAISIMNYIAETVPVVVMGRSQGIPCYEVRIDEAGAMEKIGRASCREGGRSGGWDGEA